MIPILRNVFTKYTFLLLLLSACIGVQVSFAQVTFSVVCPQTEIGKEDLLEIEFKVSNAEYIESIIPPDFKNFSIVSGPNLQRGMNSMNGKTDTYVSISFMLKPLKPGTYKIGLARAKADGKEYSTKPVTIKISKESNSNPSVDPGNNSPFSGLGNNMPLSRPSTRLNENILQPGENAEEKLKHNIFLKLDVNKTACYVGEPITAAFKVYTRLNSQTNVIDMPSFNGFSVSEMDFNRDMQIEEYNGRKYNVYTLRKVQLYPMQEGNIVLTPLVANNRAIFFTADYAKKQQQDLFFDMLENFAEPNPPENAVIDKNIELKSDPQTIHVKALPVPDVPENFKGAVGNFIIDAVVDKNHLTTDDAGNVQITISGSGNIQLINAPVITWPEGIEGYEAKMKEDLDKSSVPINGRKIFTYPFTLSKVGNFELPAISFSYFDPQSSTYKTVQTAPIPLQVKQGAKRIASDSSKNQPGGNAGFVTTHSSEITYGIIASVLILMLILLYRNNRKKNKERSEKEIIIDDLKNAAPVKQAIPTIPENPLLEAHDKLVEGNAHEFFAVLNSSMKKYLAGKLTIPLDEISRKRIQEEMDTHNVGVGTASMVCALFTEIEMNLYSMPQQQHLQSAFEKASEVVALLDKQCEGRMKR